MLARARRRPRLPAIAVSLLSVSSHAIRQGPRRAVAAPPGARWLRDRTHRRAGVAVVPDVRRAGRSRAPVRVRVHRAEHDDHRGDAREALVPHPRARGRGRRRDVRPQHHLRRQAAVPEGRRIRRRQPVRLRRAASAAAEGHQRRPGGRRARDRAHGLDAERQRRGARRALPGSGRLAVPHRRAPRLPDHPQGRRHPGRQGGAYLARASGRLRPRMDCRRRLRQRHRTGVHALGRHHRHDDLLRRPARRRARRAHALGRRRCVPEAARGDRHRQAAAYRRLPAADDDAGASGAVGAGAVPRRRARCGLPRQPVQRPVQHRPGDAPHRHRRADRPTAPRICRS